MHKIIWMLLIVILLSPYINLKAYVPLNDTTENKEKKKEHKTCAFSKKPYLTWISETTEITVYVTTCHNNGQKKSFIDKA